jgi:hypothetical protein
MWSLLGDTHGTMGCRLGLGRASGVPPHGLALGESYVVYMRWFQPCTCVIITSTMMDLNFHLRMTHGMFSHNHMEGFDILVI